MAHSPPEQNMLSVMKALWNEAPIAVAASHFGTFSVFNEAEAREILESSYPYVDYFCGRGLKINFVPNEEDPDGLPYGDSYDRMYGKGAFEKVVAPFRKF